MQCYDKAKYTKKQAETVRNNLKREKGRLMRIYHCPFCNSWHLTHKQSYFDDRDYHK